MRGIGSCRLFPCRVTPHICAPVAGPPVCVSPVVSVIPNPVCPFCVILTGSCVLRVVVHHFVKCVLTFLAVVFTLPFVFVLAFVLVRLGFVLARARLSTCLVVLQVFGFPSTVSRHVPVNSAPRNSVGGTFDLGCPSPTNHPSQPASLFVLTQRFPSFSQISSTLSYQQCWSPGDLEDHLSLNLGWQLRSNLAMLLSRHVPRMWLVFQNLSKNPWDHHWTWLRANAQVSKPSWLLKLVRVVGWEVDTLVAPPALPTWARTAVLVLPSTWSTRDTAQWKCCEPIQDQITVSWAPSQWWLLNRHGVLHRVCRCLPAHAPNNRPDKLRNTRAHSRHLSSSPSNGWGWYFDTNAPIPCSCCSGTAALFSFLFAPTYDRASSCCVAWACRSASVARASAFLYSLAHLSPASKDLLCLRHSSTPSALSALTTARQCRLHDETTQHQSLYRGSTTIDEFLQHKCCGSDDMPVSGTRTEWTQLVYECASSMNCAEYCVQHTD